MPVLPQFQDDDRTFQMMQNQWASLLNPIINRLQNQSILLTNVSLFAASSPNVINHLLARKLQGWKVVRQRGGALIWDEQDSNQTPMLTLHLKTSSDVSVDLEVF